MSLVASAPVNLRRLLRNARARLKKPPDYVWIEVRGSLPEFESRPGFLRRRLSPGPSAPSLEKIRGQLERVSGDGRPRGVALRVGNLDAGWAALEELRAEISLFRERGGRIIAYLVDPDTRAYYLACAADEILASPLSTVGVVGVRTRVDFVRDALSRVGVEAEVVAVSPYKSAGDALTRNDFSEESREQAGRLLDGRFGELVDAVASGRNISPEEARAKIDRAPFGAPGAVAEGLLDGALYEDELPERLGADGARARLAEWDVARRTLRSPYRKMPRRRVGLVSLSGTIVRGRNRRLPFPLPFVGGEQAGSESVVGALRAAEKNGRVAAVLFHVDSRGGDALASDLIWREVERIRAKKPVVVLMGNAAASGGYYVSAAADHVVARRNTVTGSIGVIVTRPVAAELYGKLGVNPVSLERGSRAGLLDPAQRPTPDELRVLEDQLRFFYDGFKDRVSRGRGLEPRALEAVAGGRVWSGVEARERGLVDELGGLRTALGKAQELADIEGDAPGTLLKIAPPRSGRPSPGEPAEAVTEAVESAKRAVLELRVARVWAISPYEVHGD